MISSTTWRPRFGLGYSPGRAAIVSSFRLKRRARSRKQVRFRVATTALHEAGHMFGLPHCTEPRCPMRDAEGTMSSTDDSEGHLGPDCQAQLNSAAPMER
jgi:archaemetzincin